MKFTIRLAAAAAMIIPMAACNESWNPDDLIKEHGMLDLTTMHVDVDAQIQQLSRNGDGEGNIDVNAFTVTITNASSGEQMNQWTVGSMPEVVTLPVGNYQIDVENAPLQPAAWDAPWYHQSAKVTIAKDEVTHVDPITCTIGNVLVSVGYSDALKASLGPDTKVAVYISPESPLTYTVDEQRIGYFALPDGASTLVAEFTGTVNGKSVSLRKSFDGIAVAQLHAITFSINKGQVDPSIIIDADITYDDVDIDIPGNEDPVPPTPPSDDIPTITSQTLDLDNVNQVTDGLVAIVNIDAPLGLAHLWVTIVSDGLTPKVLAEVGLTDKFDLAYPGEYVEALQGLGFPTGADVIGKTSLKFDISQFVPLLPLFPGNHNFILDVEDQAGNKVSKTVKFYAEAQ